MQLYVTTKTCSVSEAILELSVDSNEGGLISQSKQTIYFSKTEENNTSDKESTYEVMVYFPTVHDFH